MSTLLASYANLTLYLAMAALALAMIAFAVHVAFWDPAEGRRGARAGDGAAEGDTGLQGTDTRANDLPESARVQIADLVVSGSHRPMGASAQSGEENPSQNVRTWSGLDDAGVTSATPASPDSGGPGEGEGNRGRSSGRWGMTLSWLGAFLLLGSIVMRGASVGRAPVGNMFEFAVFGSMLVMVVYLGMSLRWPLQWLGLFVVIPVLLTLGLALTVWYTEAAELLPSLKSIWLAIHVPVATLAVAVYTIAFSVLLVQLVKARHERRRVGGSRLGPSVGAFLDQLPSSAALDRTAYALHVVAFPLWTFSLIAGAIWAQQAWGSYWNWDPKEVWTFVIWVIYAAYLHARATSGWSIKTANILALVGFGAIIVNFTIVNLFFIGQHSYSGLG